MLLLGLISCREEISLELNPNFALNLFAMAWTEAVSGLTESAKEHAHLALKLSPRDSDVWTGEAHAALGLANFFEGNHAEAVRWGHLAYQNQPVLKVFMIAANACLGDLTAARAHTDTLNSFAPEFLTAVISGEVQICKLPEHNELLIDGLRKAGI